MEKILDSGVTKRFVALALIKKDGKINELYGDLKDFSIENLKKSSETDTGKTTIIFTENQKLPSLAYMVIDLNKNSPESDMLVGQIEISSLWGIGYENMLPPMTGLCIVDQFRKILISSFPVSGALLHRVTITNDNNSIRCVTSRS